MFSIFQHLTRMVIANSNGHIGHKDAYPIRNEQDVTTQDVEYLIQDAISCMERRADLQFIAFRRIMLMSLDTIAMFGMRLIEKKTMFFHLSIS
jgi:hypothetical protein